MSTYYFHVRGQHTEMLDLVGKDCPSIEAARERAVRWAQDILVDEILRGDIHLEDRIEVEDRDLRPVIILPFGEAVRTAENE